MSTDPRAEVIAELRTQTDLLRQILAALQPSAAAVPANLLSGTHGDPIVRAKDPNDWTGESMKGRQFSECPPEYLDLLASRYEYFAGREEDATKKRYNELDAKRARGWAALIRGGWKVPERKTAERVDERQGEPQW